MELTHVLQAKKDGNDTYTTMGWTLANDHGQNLLFKDGGMPGYRTFLGIDLKNKIGVVVLSNSNNSVTDIGEHFLDVTRKVEPYKYTWQLLDTLRTTSKTKGIDQTIALYKELKATNNKAFVFNKNQLNYLGGELRKAGKIKDAIKIFNLNVEEYPKSTLVYESLADLYKRNNNKKAAIYNFEKACELDPKNQYWAYILGQF